MNIESKYVKIERNTNSRILTKERKSRMAKDRTGYLLSRLVKSEGISYDDAYTWLITSRTYSAIMDLDGLFYYASHIGLWDILLCEYEGRMEDWRNKINCY